MDNAALRAGGIFVTTNFFVGLWIVAEAHSFNLYRWGKLILSGRHTLLSSPVQDGGRQRLSVKNS